MFGVGGRDCLKDVIAKLLPSGQQAGVVLPEVLGARHGHRLLQVHGVPEEDLDACRLHLQQL